jgi:hypothetical protein
LDILGSKLNMDTKDIQEKIAWAQNKFPDGFMGNVFQFFSGRSTFFACAIFIAGVVLAVLGKLTTNFVSLMGVVQALVVFHSTQENYHERAMQTQNQSTQVVNNITVDADAGEKEAKK